MIKQYLDFQQGIKHDNIKKLRDEDKTIAKIGIEKEEQDMLKRNDYFEKLQKFQDLNNQKFDSLVKYMKSDPTVAAEERDKKM